MFALNARMQMSTPNAPDATLSDLTGSSKLLVPGKVISSSRIPQGVLSMPINPETLRGVTEVVQISVGTNSFGTLDLEASSKRIWNSDVHWTRALRIADDCHSYNIQLRKNPHHLNNRTGQKIQTLSLQAVRPVEPGQELLLWFSEEILATLHMGFLTPANIQGQKNYVCTRCSALYESPNPLKLHLTLGCGKQTMTWLWEQLSNTLTKEFPTSSSAFQFKLMNEPLQTIPKQKIPIDLSSPSSLPPQLKKGPNENLSISSSAFKPFKKTSIPTPVANVQQNNNVYTSMPHWPRFAMPSDYVHSVHTPYHPLSSQIPRACTDDAQIETLVSSLGKYKEGHICLYCGKSYSRKYGLKIHIRTHTGYKPLKCKYCLRPFGDPSNLNKHVRLHAEGETPYKCEICGKVLVRRRDLERHMKSRHSGDLTPTSTFLNDEETNFINSSDDEPQSMANDSGEENSVNVDIEDSNNSPINENDNQ